MKRFSLLTAVSLAALLLPTSMKAARAEGGDEVERIQDSVQVLNDLTRSPDDRIPQYLLERAEAIVVNPDMIRGGFVVGAKHGKGIVSVRKGDTDRWSPPAFIKMTGGSVGWQIGAQSVDLVLLVMNPSGVRKLLDNRFTLGGELSATAGPVGRSTSAATDITLDSEILTYSRAKGLFAGATFEGVALTTDDGANRAFYGESLRLDDIVLTPKNGLRIPFVASTWTDRLRELGRSVETSYADRPADWRTNPSARDVPRPTFEDDAARRGSRSESERASAMYTPPADFRGKLVSVRELAEHPKSHYGQQVMLAASVESLYSRSIFALDDDPLLSTQQRVLVVAPNVIRPVADHAEVAVIGEVIKFDRGDIEKRVPGYRLDLADDMMKSLDDMPAIVASSIRTKDGQELIDYRTRY